MVEVSIFIDWMQDIQKRMMRSLARSLFPRSLMTQRKMSMLYVSYKFLISIIFSQSARLS